MRPCPMALKGGEGVVVRTLLPLPLFGFQAMPESMEEPLSDSAHECAYRPTAIKTQN